MEIIEVKEYERSYYESIQKMLGELTAVPTDMTEEFFKEIIASGNSHLFLLRKEDKVIGMLTLGTYKSPTGSKAWIEDVVITAGCRGRGYGRLLVRYAIDFSKETGIKTLMLTSRPSRRAANALYRSLGFEQRETNVYGIKF